MSTHEVKLPDVGEGVAEAELVSWAVAVGDQVAAESPLAEVLTDKATVEIAAPVSGTVTELRGEIGDVLAVGSIFVVIDTGGEMPPAEAADSAAEPAEADEPGEPAEDVEAAETVVGDQPPQAAPPRAVATPAARRALAAPAVRQRALELGLDLGTVAGSGPEGRVVHGDLDRVLTSGQAAAQASPQPVGGSRVEPVRALRRRIAQRLSASWSSIPHITYVDAVDVTEVEKLRAELNGDDASVRLTLLPFLIRAIVIAAGEQPTVNATYDAAAEELTIHDTVHVGIATQTDDGLVVPVLRDAGSRSLTEAATEIARLAEAARKGMTSRDELSGSTITITSLGPLGGLVTTPLINAPEVAIVGVNKIETRPVWRDGAFVPRQMMNLSSSFDHRIVDGFEAANFVQRIRQLLETPALMFLD